GEAEALGLSGLARWNEGEGELGDIGSDGLDTPVEPVFHTVEPVFHTVEPVVRTVQTAFDGSESLVTEVAEHEANGHDQNRVDEAQHAFHDATPIRGRT